MASATRFAVLKRKIHVARHSQVAQLITKDQHGGVHVLKGKVRGRYTVTLLFLTSNLIIAAECAFFK